MLGQLLLLTLFAKHIASEPPYTCTPVTCPTNNEIKVDLSQSSFPTHCGCPEVGNDRNYEITFINPQSNAEYEIPYGFFNGGKISKITIAKQITTIADGAFYDCIINDIVFEANSQLSEISTYGFCQVTFRSDVSLPPTLTTIGEKAFYGSYFNSALSLPTTLTEIGKEAFYSCSFYYSTSLSFPSGFKKIGESAFQGSNLQHMSFNDNARLDSIGKNAFNGLRGLQIDGTSKAIYCTTIGENAFNGASSINFLTINAKTISKYAFQNCVSLNADIIIEPSGSIGDSAFLGCETLQGTLTIKARTDDDDDYSTISQNAFQDTPITDINLPHLESIGDSAFAGCDRLTGESTEVLDAEDISANAFDGCERVNFKSIKADNIYSDAFHNCFSLFCQEGILIDSYGSIQSCAFQNCLKLNGTLTIAPTYSNSASSSIGDYAFQNTAIQKFNLPHLTSIGAYAFENCARLIGQADEENDELFVDKIKNNAFQHDTLLHFSVIKTEGIQGKAFQYCRNLGSDIVIYEGGEVSSYAFNFCDKLGNFTIDLHYREENTLQTTGITINEHAFENSGLTGPLVIPYTVQTIGDHAFAYCPNIRSLEINSIYSIRQTIDQYAFYKSNIGTQLTIPASVIAINNHAFALTTVETLRVLGTNYADKEKTGSDPVEYERDSTVINKDSFLDCTNLSTLIFGDDFIDFKADAFRGCKLTSLSLGQITKIPDNAFLGMSSINKEVVIPDSVTSIGKNAFSECNQIPKIMISPNSRLNTIDDAAFYKCSQITEAIIPSGVNSVPQYAFYRCTNLTTLSLPSTLNTISTYAFYGCTKLEGPLVLPAHLTGIGPNAFEKCGKLRGSLALPNSLTSIGEQAFDGCGLLSGGLDIGPNLGTIGKFAFRDCIGLDGNLNFVDHESNKKELYLQEGAFYGCSGLKGPLSLIERCKLQKSQTETEDSPNVFNGCSSFSSLFIPETIKNIPDGTFCGCTGLTGELNTNFETIGHKAFYNCSGLTGPLDFTSLGPNLQTITIAPYAFYNCRGLTGPIILKDITDDLRVIIGDYAFYGCSGLTGELNTSSLYIIGNHAFSGCTGLTGPLKFGIKLVRVGEYAFSDCTGFSNTLSFRVLGGKELSIEECAFKGCSGFKDGKLSFVMDHDDSHKLYQHSEAQYIVKIENQAFEGTKFKDIRYLGKQEPDCDCDIGLPSRKGIHTASNYQGKKFCGNPLHKSSLSGGAIAGIVIACIVVVAVIIFLIIFFIRKNKNNKDQSEAEVEMNQDP